MPHTTAPPGLSATLEKTEMTCIGKTSTSGAHPASG